MRHLWFALLAVLLVMPAAPAMAQDWGNFAMISSTLGVQANRLCIGEGLRVGDIGCPAYAPSVTTAGDVSVTGNLSANRFIGDGSGLTGITADATDRIVSGTADRTRIVAVSNTGFISITQNNTDTGWFDPARGLVALGVSATGAVSGSAGYFRERLGIGTTSALAAVNIEAFWTQLIARRAGNAGISLSGDWPGVGFNTYYNGALRAIGPGYTGGLTLTPSTGLLYFSLGNAPGANNTVIDHIRMVITNAGRVGISTTEPSATLHVEGSARITSWTAMAANVTPTVELDVHGRISATQFIGDGSLLTNLPGGGGTPDRIVSGTKAAYISPTGTVFINGRLEIVTGSYVVGIGPGAAAKTSAYGSLGVGVEALENNTAAFATGIGVQAGENNTGSSLIAVGTFAGQGNTGANVVAIGSTAGTGNVGQGAVLIGTAAGTFNRGNSVTIVGDYAGIGVNGQATAHGSIFLGHRSGYGVTNAERNTFLGSFTGDNVTSGDDNILIGYEARTPAAASSNFLNIGNAISGTMSANGSLTFIGGVKANGIVTATYFEGDGSRLTGISGGGGDTDRIVSGTKAAYISPTGTVFMNGRLNIVTGTENVLIGGDAGITNTGSRVTGVGQWAGYQNSGSDAVIIGRWAGIFNTGSNAVLVGQGAGVGNNGNRVVAVGNGAGSAGSGATHDSVFVGYYTGHNTTSAERNVFLGGYTGVSVTTGDDNILVGYNMTTPSNTTSNFLNIGNAISGTMTANGSLTFIGGVKANGIVTATYFEGDGSRLTGISGGGGDTDRIVSGTTSVIAHEDRGISTTTPMDVSGSMRISGTMKLAGTGSEGCGPSTYGTIRRNPVTGAVQVCVQR